MLFYGNNVLVYYKNVITSKAVLFCHFLPCRFLQYISRNTLCSVTQNNIYSGNNKLDAVGIQASTRVQWGSIEIIHNEEKVILMLHVVLSMPQIIQHNILVLWYNQCFKIPYMNNKSIYSYKHFLLYAMADINSVSEYVLL